MSDDTLTRAAAAPLAERGRIAEIDVIRGLALFGVLWMNLYAITNWLVPPQLRQALATARVDDVVTQLSDWLLSGKAQTAFGVLFGFGFDVFIERAGARGGPAATLFARRLAFLLALGLLHYVFLWWGDIVHDYALTGFALLLVRRWPASRLAALGLCLVLLSPLVSAFAGALIGDGARHGLGAARAQFHRAIWHAVSTGDYGATLRAIRWRSAAVYGDGNAAGYFASLFGQFLLGAALFRTGWLQQARTRRTLFRRVALAGIPLGLALAALDPADTLIGHAPFGLPHAVLAVLGQAAELVLAAGYAAGAVIATQSPSLARICSGPAAVGRMALTNYVAQSVFFFVVIDGFGLRLIGRTGMTLDAAIAVLVFALQMLFSRWWLQHFRFGPLEWLWRSATYGGWQTFAVVRA